MSMDHPSSEGIDHPQAEWQEQGVEPVQRSVSESPQEQQDGLATVRNEEDPDKTVKFRYQRLPETPREVDADGLEDTDKRPAIVLPRAGDGNGATPREERALRYLEKKQTRPERITGQFAIVRADGDQNGLEPVEERSEAMMSQKTGPVPVVMGRSKGSVGLQDGDFSMVAVSRRTLSTQDALRARRHRMVILRHLSRKHMRQTRKDERTSFARFWTTLLSSIAAVLIILLTVIGGGTYAAYRFYTDTQTAYSSTITSLRNLLPKDNLKMYDMNNTVIGQLTDQGIHTAVPLNQIAQNLQQATVAVEDKDFWKNPGIDIQRILQAALDDLLHGHVVEGGSTITQQLIKNLVLQNQKQDVIRKLQEIVLTPALNSHYSKSDILEMYLNSIYYGEQAYGVDSAATVYFGLEDQPGKPAAAQLDLAQAATLAGIPSAPSAYDPLLNPKTAFARFQTVLDLMLRHGDITNAQAEAAITEAQSPDFFKRPASLENRAPHFFNFVLDQLKQQFHMTKAQLSRSDMKVYTTLDMTMQDEVLQIARDHIAKLANFHVTNAAEVVIDYHTGAIRTMLGSIDYNNTSIDGQYDVTQAYRQPGSSFKPYVYLTAFAKGISPGQPVFDAPLTIQMPPGSNPPTFTPTNYFHDYNGHITLRCALQNSLNIPAVKVLQHVGIDTAVKTAHDMGVSTVGTPGYSMVLGGLQVRLLDHTSAYGAFANGGVHMPYYGIEKVVFANTHQTWGHVQEKGKQVMSPQLAYMMTNVLEDTQDRLPDFGYCNPLELHQGGGCTGPLIPVAAKTGTTNNFKDDWTMGYTTDFVMGVWTGNDDDTPTKEINGIMGAAPIWHDAMLAIEKGHNPHEFNRPDGLDTVTMTYPDGVHTTDLFLHGMEPTPTPTPTPSPTPTGDNNGNPTPTPNQNDNHPPVTTRPYCPASFNYAFQPPADNAGAW